MNLPVIAGIQSGRHALGAAPVDQPRANRTGDPYYTDGLRIVMWVSNKLTDLQDIEYLDWFDPAVSVP